MNKQYVLDIAAKAANNVTMDYRNKDLCQWAWNEHGDSLVQSIAELVSNYPLSQIKKPTADEKLIIACAQYVAKPSKRKLEQIERLK